MTIDTAEWRGMIHHMTEKTQKSDPPSQDEGRAATGDDHRRRMRFEWQDLMDDLIEDGRRRGLFDDLPGRGRPLNLDKHVYEGGNSLANQLMKDNDVRPAWLSHRLDVVAKVEGLREEIGRAWERYREAFERAHGDSHRPALTLGWDDNCQRWQETMDGLNKEIELYNLKRPSGQPEIYKLRLADELKRANAPRYLK